MKIFILILPSLIFLLPCNLTAQQPQWETYMGKYENGPGSTIVDMAVKNAAPVKDMPLLLVTGILLVPLFYRNLL